MLTYFKYILSLVYSKRKRSKAFTLIELLIVTAIATAMMTTLVIQQNSWNDGLALRSQAYELVLMIRQAQLYSLGVKEDTDGPGDKFSVGYGIDMNDNALGQYIFFADRNNNSINDTGEQIGNPINFSNGVEIEKVCGVQKPPSTGIERCFFGPAGPKRLNVSFYRPEPKANVVFLNPDTKISNYHAPATIHLISPKGSRSIITVEANGQISMQ